MNETTDNSPPIAATETAPRRSRARTLLFAGGAVLAGALLTGGGMVVGAAINDDDDDRHLVSQSELRGDGQIGMGSATGTSATDAVGATSATELLDIIETASTEADGAPVDIEAVRGGGWDVQFETASGDESEVRVQADGTARIVSTETADQDDQAPAGQLDTATVEALVTAALNAADGTITNLSVDNDTVSPYSASILAGDGRIVDIDFDAMFIVIGTDTDTDD